jgi:hypothetical protein
MKKNRLNWLKFWKNRPVQFGFGFISLKPNWTEPRPEKTEQKPKKPSQNRTKPKKSSQTGLNRLCLNHVNTTLIYESLYYYKLCIFWIFFKKNAYNQLQFMTQIIKD